MRFCSENRKRAVQDRILIGNTRLAVFKRPSNFCILPNILNRREVFPPWPICSKCRSPDAKGKKRKPNFRPIPPVGWSLPTLPCLLRKKRPKPWKSHDRNRSTSATIFSADSKITPRRTNAGLGKSGKRASPPATVESKHPTIRSKFENRIQGRSPQSLILRRAVLFARDFHSHQPHNGNLTSRQFAVRSKSCPPIAPLCLGGRLFFWASG